MKCSIDDSTGLALSDFRNEARPGVFAMAGEGIVALEARPAGRKGRGGAEGGRGKFGGEL